MQRAAAPRLHLFPALQSPRCLTLPHLVHCSTVTLPILARYRLVTASLQADGSWNGRQRARPSRDFVSRSWWLRAAGTFCHTTQSVRCFQPLSSNYQGGNQITTRPLSHLTTLSHHLCHRHRPYETGMSHLRSEEDGSWWRNLWQPVALPLQLVAPLIEGVKKAANPPVWGCYFGRRVGTTSESSRVSRRVSPQRKVTTHRRSGTAFGE